MSIFGLASLQLDRAAPITIQLVGSSAEFLIAKRHALRRKTGIPQEAWAVTGAYVLLGSPTTASRERGLVIQARPGSATDLLDRMRRHLADASMNWFERAVMIRGMPPHRFIIAHAVHLEGLLHDLCRDAAKVESNFRRDGEGGLREQEALDLRDYVLPATQGVLELLGVPTETTEELAALVERSPRTRADAETF